MNDAARAPILPIPAIDLSGGRVVRLFRGERDRETAYPVRPVAMAEEFAAAGAAWLHVVDLDGAFGDGGNRDTVGELLAAAPLAVQVAGGVRTVREYARLREAGAARVVFGTIAVEAPEVVEEAIRLDPDGVAVALDVKGGRLATRGWVETAAGPAWASSAPAAARRWGRRGAAAVIYTRVEKDGTLEGPDEAGALKVARAAGVPTILAGGVGSLDHLRALAASEAVPRLSGVILGRSLYDRRFTFAEALATLAGQAGGDAGASRGRRAMGSGCRRGPRGSRR